MRIQYFFIFLLFILLLLFTYIIFSPFISQETTSNLLLYSIGKLTGLIGFLFLSVLIISGDTARFFDRFFGMDRIIKFQRKFSLIISVFLISHPLFFILSGGNYLTYIIPDFAVPPLAFGIISLYIFIVIIVCSVLYKRISYQIWQYIHILTYVLFFSAFYHALNIGSDTGNVFVKSIFGVLLIVLIMSSIYRIYYKVKHSEFKYHVKEIKWETHDTFTLRLKQNKKLFFKPGQFCFLRINKNKLYARHPFTISSSPNEDTLDFTMKITGRFTKTASQLKEGEEVIVDGPFGIFTIKDEKKDLVFIAGGVGITPFASMIKERLHSKEQQNITLLYGSKTKEDIIFRKELDEVKEEWFKNVYVLSNEEIPEKDQEQGRVTIEILKKYVKDVNNSLFYLCGPEPMKVEIIKILKNIGVRNENIRIESFFW